MVNNKSFQKSSILLSVLFFTCYFTCIAASKPANTRTEKEFVYFTKRNTTEFTVRYKGNIKVSENDKDISSISPNGYLIVEQISFGNKRKIELRSDNTGKLTKTYSEGKNQEKYQPNGAEWFESLMPSLIYQTAIGGPERIIRIYKNKGIRIALAEAEKMRTKGGDGSTFFWGYYSHNINYAITKHNLYYKAIIDHIDLDNNELAEYIQSLESMRSNSNKGSILRTVLEKYKLTPQLMEYFFETTASLDYNTERGNTLRIFMTKYNIDESNYKDFFKVINGMNINSEKGNVLKPLLDNQKISNKVFIALLESVSKLTNNSEKAAILRKAIHKLPNNKEIVETFANINNSMSSPYRLLKKEINNLILDKSYLTNNETYTKDSMISIMNNLYKVEPNTKKSTVLRKLHSYITNDAELVDAYFRVVETMDNTVEKYNLVLEFMEDIELNNYIYSAIYAAAEDIAKQDNLHAASAILRATIKNMPNDDKTIVQFFDVLEDIESNSGREEIIRLLIQNKKASSDYAILTMLKIAANIDVDIEKALALKYIGNIIPKSNKEAIFLHKRLADELEQDYEYKRALGINEL